ncbi:hypothetical protein AAMO2058_001189400 [Amorphochlora amoebiformis]
MSPVSILGGFLMVFDAGFPPNRPYPRAIPPPRNYRFKILLLRLRGGEDGKDPMLSTPPNARAETKPPLGDKTSHASKPFGGAKPQMKLFRGEDGQLYRKIWIPASKGPLGNPFEVTQVVKAGEEQLTLQQIIPKSSMFSYMLSANDSESLGTLQHFYDSLKLQGKDRSLDVPDPPEIKFVKQLKCAKAISGNMSLRGYKDGSGPDALFDSPLGIALSTCGDYVVADSFNRVIRVVTPSGHTRTLAGSGRCRALDGLGTEASFRSPNGMSVSANGDIYVADTWAHKIRKISPNGETTTVCGTGLADYTDGLASRSRNLDLAQGLTKLSLNKHANDYDDEEMATLNGPSDVAWDKSNNGILYIADTGNRAIRKLNLSSGVVVSVVSPGDFNPRLSPQDKHKIRQKRMDERDTLHFLHIGDTLESLPKQGERLRETNRLELIDEPESEWIWDGGILAKGNFGFIQPGYIDVSPNGDVYVSDKKLHQIWKITPEGERSIVAGSIVGNQDGYATNAKFTIPTGLAVSQDGHVYVADTGNFVCRRISPDGLVFTVAELGRQAVTEDYLRFPTHYRKYPMGIALGHGDRRLLFADPMNHQIRQVPIPRFIAWSEFDSRPVSPRNAYEVPMWYHGPMGDDSLMRTARTKNQSYNSKKSENIYQCPILYLIPSLRVLV